METKSININANNDSATIHTIIYKQTDEELIEVSDNRKAYVNDNEGMVELITEQSESTVNAVFAVWDEQLTITNN